MQELGKFIRILTHPVSKNQGKKAAFVDKATHILTQEGNEYVWCIAEKTENL